MDDKLFIQGLAPVYFFHSRKAPQSSITEVKPESDERPGFRIM